MTVVITKPATGATLTGTAQVEATFSGQNFEIGTATIDGQQVASDASQPISLSIDTARVADGPHTLTVAVRYRTSGGVRRWQKASIPITTEGNDMEVTITTNKGTTNLTGTVVVTATVTPAKQAVTPVRCDFYVDGTVKASDTSYPLTFSWDTTQVADGGHTLKASVVAKNRSRVVQISVGVKNAVTPPPPPPPGGVPVNTVAPSISGTATEGQTLVMNYGTWTNNPTSYTLQWLRCDAAGANWISIPASTAPTYTLHAEDVGSTIRCAIVAYNAVGPSVVLRTAQTAVVAALAPAVPVNVTAPMISGTPIVGNGLTCSNGSWTNSPTSYTRQWKRAGAPVIGDTRVLSDGDSGNGNLMMAQSAALAVDATVQSLSFYVVNPAGLLRLGIYNDAGGRPGTKKAVTNEFTPVAGWNVVNVVTPTALTAGTYWLAYLSNNNALSFRKGYDSSSSIAFYAFPYAAMPTTFSTTPTTEAGVHFSFCATMSGAASGNISGATSASYTVATADIGSTLTCATVAVNASGSSTAVDAASTGVVQAAQTPPPPPPPPPPSPSNRYTDINFAAGKYDGEGIRSVFEAYQSDSRLASWGGQDPINYDNYGMTTDPNQRVHLFHPASVGLPTVQGSSWASWHELRTTDGPWQAAASNLAKASLSCNDPITVTWGPSGFSYGAVRWFAWDILFPLNIGGVSLEFNNSWGNTMFDLHTSVDFDDDPCLGDIWPHSGNPRYLAFTQTPSQSVSYVNVPLLQLTESNGTRRTASYNVWHEVVVGMKASKDSSGWYEIWFNGSQVVGQTPRQMLSPADTGPYMQMQNYTSYPTSYISGATRSAVCYGGFRAGLTRADVQTR